MADPPYTGPKIEARASLGRYVADVPRELQVEDFDKEARVYGSRWVKVEDAGGGSRFEEVPLRWEDLFDPREGDRLVHSSQHGKTLRDIGARLDCLYAARGRDDVVVFDDVRIDWKTPGVRPACPDVSVIPGVKKGERAPKSFSEKKAGTGPCFVLEITSEETADYDRTEKPKIYRAAKVPEIFLLDEMRAPWELKGERLHPKTGRYRKIRPDRRGRLLAETLGVYFSISASGDDLVMEDVSTGEVLRKPVAELQARQVAERQAAEEAEARQAAERQAIEDAEARQAAERQAADAERRVAEEAEARAAAEATVQELLAEIRRLRSRASGEGEGHDSSG